MQYIYSDDESSTWSAPTTISTGSFDLFAPYGKVININSNQVLSTWYGRNIAGGNTNYSAIINISSDYGSTWGPNISVISSGTTSFPSYGEPHYVYLGSNNIIGMIRIDSSSSMRQVLSTDNGNTWTSQGNITFDTATGGMTPWMASFDNPNGDRVVACYYQDRTEKKIRSINGWANDLIANGVNGWITASRKDVYSLIAGWSGGYPTVTYTNNTQSGFGAFYDDTTEFNAFLVFFRPDPFFPADLLDRYRTRRSTIGMRRR